MTDEQIDALVPLPLNDSVSRGQHAFEKETLLAHTRAAVRAALAKHEVSRWRPIGGAPKDGTLVLLYRPDLRSETHAVCRWSRRFNDWSPVRDGNFFSNPIAWMPLPDTPGEQQ